MIADVRLKIHLRLRETLARLEKALVDPEGLKEQVNASLADPRIFHMLMMHCEDTIRFGFPGCTIRLEKGMVCLTLPNRYPYPHIPVREQCPPTVQMFLEALKKAEQGA